MEKIIHKHKFLWSQKSFCLSTFFGVSFFFVSLFINYVANIYISSRTGNHVSDLILDNLPVVNVEFIFFEGFMIFLALTIFFLLREPLKIPFAIKSIAIFMIIRSVFITLTHLAAPIDHSFVDLNRFIQEMSSGNDLFFSGHTGLPFLIALNFWENKRLKLLFVLISLVFGASVLLGHLHYSIDVFAAFFITYGIFVITKKIFPKDYNMLLEKEAE